MKTELFENLPPPTIRRLGEYRARGYWVRQSRRRAGGARPKKAAIQSRACLHTGASVGGWAERWGGGASLEEGAHVYRRASLGLLPRRVSPARPFTSLSPARPRQSHKSSLILRKPGLSWRVAAVGRDLARSRRLLQEFRGPPGGLSISPDRFPLSIPRGRQLRAFIERPARARMSRLRDE